MEIILLELELAQVQLVLGLSEIEINGNNVKSLSKLRSCASLEVHMPNKVILCEPSKIEQPY
jgi:hypothetical protein